MDVRRLETLELLGDSLERRREEAGISYIVIQGGQHELVEQFAEEIVKPLAGK